MSLNHVYRSSREKMTDIQQYVKKLKEHESKRLSTQQRNEYWAEIQRKANKLKALNESEESNV